MHARFVSRRRPGAHAAVLGTLKAAPVGARMNDGLPYRHGRRARFPTPSNLFRFLTGTRHCGCPT